MKIRYVQRKRCGEGGIAVANSDSGMANFGSAIRLHFNAIMSPESSWFDFERYFIRNFVMKDNFTVAVGKTTWNARCIFPRKRPKHLLWSAFAIKLRSLKVIPSVFKMKNIHWNITLVYKRCSLTHHTV